MQTDFKQLIEKNIKSVITRNSVSLLYGLLVITFILVVSCNSSFDDNVVKDPKFASGLDFETHKIIQPIVFHFDNYTFVEGNDSSSSTLGLYYGNKEIFLSKHSDGMFDTIMKANLNNDGVPDFLVEYSYEDGATLLGLLSKSQTSYIEKELSSEISDFYCGELGDTAKFIQQFSVTDINNDGKEEVIINAIKMNGKLFGIACTDTIYPEK